MKWANAFGLSNVEIINYYCVFFFGVAHHNKLHQNVIFSLFSVFEQIN